MELVEPAYRSSIFSTQPQKRIVARLTHFDGPLKRVLAKVRVTLWGPSSEQLAEATLDEVGQEATFDASALAPGRYAVSYGTSAGGTIEQALVVHVLPPAPSEVYLDAEGILQVNGVPFFPIGLFHVGDNLNQIQEDSRAAGEPLLTMEEIHRRVAEKGFNTVANISSVSESLDLAAKYGLRVLQWVSLSDRPAERAVRQRKTHPALLGWSLNDEPQLNVIVKYRLLDRFMQMKNDDPYHPVWVAQHADFVHGVYTYDILFAEYYHWDRLTIGDRGRLAVLPGTATQIARARAAVRPGQAVWLLTQACSAGPYTVASPKEYRNRVYQGIVSGVRGVAVFTYHYGEVMEDGLRWRMDLHSPRLWRSMGRINEELRRIMPILVAPGGEYDLEVEGAPGIRYLKREQEDKLYIIAVNVGRKPQAFELGLPSKWTRAKLILQERSVRLDDGRLKDWLDLFGARAYEVR